MHSICTLGLISSLHIFLRGGQKSRTPRNESASRQKYEGTTRRGRGLPLKSPRSLRLQLGAIARGAILARWLSVSCTLVGYTVIAGVLATLMTFHRIIRWTEERFDRPRSVLARRSRYVVTPYLSSYAAGGPRIRAKKDGRTPHLRLSINPRRETNALSGRVLGLSYG